MYISKHLFQEKLASISCSEFHGWTTSCREAFISFTLGGTKGTAVFFLTMYSAQYILRRKKITREEMKMIAKDFVQSMLFAYTYKIAFITYICGHRKLLGRFDYYWSGFGTPLAVSFMTYFSPPSRQHVEATYYWIMALECLIKKSAFHGLLSKSKASGTPYFMILNAIIMQLLWKKQNVSDKLDITWIFKPYSKKENCGNTLCSHKGSCLNDFIKVSTKYFLIGLGISTAKLIIKKIQKPKMSLLNMFSMNMLNEPVFLFLYVAVQKAVHCSLTRYKGEDKEEHAAIAGFLSGLAYLIKPNISLTSSQIVLIVMALFNEAKRKFNLPKLPYQYFCFVSASMVLFNFMILHVELVPKYFPSMFTQATGGKSDIILRNIEDYARGIKVHKGV